MATRCCRLRWPWECSSRGNRGGGGEGAEEAGVAAAAEAASLALRCCAGERQVLQVSCRANLSTAFHRLQPGQRRCAHACATARTAEQQRVREDLRASRPCVLRDTACTTDRGSHAEVCCSRVEAQRISTVSTAGAARVSPASGLQHARLLPSYPCAALTCGRALLHCAAAAERGSGRGGSRQGGDFSPTLERSKQQQYKDRNDVSKRVINAEYNGTACMCV